MEMGMKMGMGMEMEGTARPDGAPARLPRLLVAGTHSGAGKTTVTLGLIAALRRRGLRVQPFKVGPDYIDPGLHAVAAGRPSRNLDPWLTGREAMLGIFRRAAAGADLALVEGVMGLHDGLGATGREGSTAEVAALLRAPVLLVADASGLSRSLAAVARGYRDLDPEVPLAGLFANRVGGAGHAALLREAVEELAGLPLLGWLPPLPEVALPEAHLGLFPAPEQRELEAKLARLAAALEEATDLDRLLALARSAPALPEPAVPPGPAGSQGGPGTSAGRPAPQPGARRPRIAVALDEAFNFYYPEMFDLFEALGAEVVPFSPLRDRELPGGAGLLILGGGFPERHAEALSANRSMREAIRRFHEAGGAIYAECGGLMYLSRAIDDRPMVGLLPARTRMTGRLAGFGYRELELARPSLLGPAGLRLRGHEFHTSALADPLPEEAAAYRMRPARPPRDSREAREAEARVEGYARGRLFASYVHVHFAGYPEVAARLV
ncbi:MAG: cobyrinate a,c-diamide synthase, partial [Bacillota bacterium]|nr:cobyrinate a,c-diamide synthase [Bacillota bacterium]